MPTVDEIQSGVAGIVDQDQDTDNISSTDYSLRLKYINRRQRTWAETGNFPQLYTEYFTQTSTSSGNTSIALPADYRRLASFPRITFDGATTYDFPEIDPGSESQYTSSDRYVKILGNESSGYYMIVNSSNAGGHLVSGASIFVPYYKSPASLASPTDIVSCSNPEYLIIGAAADIWESREDARYQAKQVEANIILQNMLQSESTPSEASTDDRVEPVEVTRYGHRMGE